MLSSLITLYFALSGLVLSVKVLLVWQDSIHNYSMEEFSSYMASQKQPIDMFLSLKAPIDEEIIDLQDYDYIFDYSDSIALSYSTYQGLRLNTKHLYCQRNCKGEFIPLKDSLNDLLQISQTLCTILECRQTIHITDFEVEALPESVSSLYYFNSRLPRLDAKHFVSRLIRPAGIKHIFVIGSPEFTSQFLSIFAEYKIDEGYAIVLLGTDCKFDRMVYPTGLLCVAYSGLEASLTPQTHEFGYMLRALQGRPLGNFDLFNVIEGALKKIGSVTKTTLTLKESLTYPGSRTTPPDASPIEVVVNMNDYFMQKEGNSREYVFHRGLKLALDENPLTNPYFTVKPLALEECFGYKQEVGYLPCYERAVKDRVVLLLSTTLDASLYYQVTDLTSRGLKMPVFESQNVVDYLSNFASFPYFVRTIPTMDYFTAHVVLILTQFQFYKVNLLLSYTYGSTAPNNLLYYLARSRITVMTPENLQIQDLYQGHNYPKDACAYIKSSSVRPVLMILSPDDARQVVLECYAQGLRRKDVVFFYVTGDLSTIADGQGAIVKETLTEFETAYFGFIPAYLMNGFDVKIYENFGEYYYTDCSSFDIGLGTVGAINFALKRGLNWFDPDDMMFALRNLRYEGCTGSIQLGFNDNNRKDMLLTMYQTFFTEKLYDLIKILDISLISSPAVQLYNQVVWYDGSSNVPKYERFTYKGCPFPEEWRRDAPESQTKTSLVMLSIFLGTFSIASGVYFKYFRNVTIQQVPQPILLSTEDMFLYLTNLIEPFQFLLIAPAQGLLDTATGGMISNAVWNNIDFSNGNFWLFINSLFAIFGIWVLIMGIIVVCKVKNSAWNLIPILLLLLRPLNFAFIYGLFTTFDCSKGEGEESIESAYMDQDCHQSCWEETHLKYAVAVALVAMTYITISVFTLSSLSYMLEGHQFISTPSYLIARIVAQVALISLYKSRWALGPDAYAGLFVVALWMYCMCLKHSINVPTLNIWHKVCHYYVLYLVLISIFHEFAYSNISLWVFCSLAGVLVFVGVTRFKSNRLPRLMVILPKIDTEALFAFAFRISRSSINETAAASFNRGNSESIT